MKKFSSKFITLIIAIVIGLGFVYINPIKAEAFEAGRIMDDGKFTNNGSMTASDIQNFLSARNAVCLVNYQTPSINGNNNYGGNVPASTAIKQAADIWGISPQVLLVTLQKEQGLVTRGDCPDWRYQTAMGFGCPDGAPCDAQWYGLSRQLYQGARHFRGFYDQSSGWYVPFTPGVRFIPYHPNGSCGGSNVNILNRATASLYSYTPYQPNAAALATRYGSGDGCSSYGNRNFSSYFEDWFGSPFDVQTNWKFEKLDGASSGVSGADGNVGPTPASMVFNSVLHVFYYDVGNGNLRHSYADTNGWHFENLDGAGGGGGRLDTRLGYHPTVVNYQNSVHVFYYDVQNGNLRHAWSDGSGGNWQFETLDGSGGGNGRVDANVGQTPTATVFNNNMYVFNHDVTNGDLRSAIWDNTAQAWNFQTLDGTASSPGKMNSNLGYEPFALTYNNTVQLFYYDSDNGNLRHAFSGNGNNWNFENLDGDPGSIGHYNSNLGRTSFGTVFGTSLQLYYYDAGQGNLRHAWADTTGWHFENLEGDSGAISRYNGDIGFGGSATVYNGSLQLYYYNISQGNLRHAWTSPSGWGFENLDGDSGAISVYSGDLGQYSTATVFNNTIQVYYQDAGAGDLRHTWFTP